MTDKRYPDRPADKPHTPQQPGRDIGKADRPLGDRGSHDPINRVDPPKPWPGKPGKK